MPKFYVVTEEDGRVKRVLPDGRRVLVAIPGRSIAWDLAVELGLTSEQPAKKAVPTEAVQKALPVKQTPHLSTYPTQKSSG